MQKKLIQLAAAVLLMMPILSFAVMPALAQTEPNIDLGLNNAASIGLGNQSPKAIIVSVIKVALGFLGVVAVIIILIGGFKWMTAQGNDDKIAEARKLIQAGVVGLVIILSAWGVTYWLITTIWNATQ